MQFRYLVYVSRLADLNGPEAIPVIIRTARVNNAIRGITGALIFDGERFCQYIEGPTDEIVRTFETIETDDRHNEVRVLASGHAVQRRFSTWSMAYVYAITSDLIDTIGGRSVPAVADAFESALSRCDLGS